MKPETQKKVNNIVNYLIFIYVGIVIFDILKETIKELYLYKQFLYNNPPKAQFQTDFIKETIKMGTKSIASKISELQTFIMGLILGGVKSKVK